jgi:hypothetical protein
MGGMIHWKDIDESRSADVVISSYQKWMEIEVLCKRYLACLATAMKLYQEFNQPTHPLPNDKSAGQIVYIYQEWVKNAPFLSGSLGSAALLAHFVLMSEPGSKRMMLASMVAHARKLEKSLFKDGALEEMRAEVSAHSGTLPAICTPWPFD